MIRYSSALKWTRKERPEYSITQHRTYLTQSYPPSNQRTESMHMLVTSFHPTSHQTFHQSPSQASAMIQQTRTSIESVHERCIQTQDRVSLIGCRARQDDPQLARLWSYDRCIYDHLLRIPEYKALTRMSLCKLTSRAIGWFIAVS